MYKVFFNNRVIVLTNNKNKHLNYNTNSCHYIPAKDNLNLLIDKFEADESMEDLVIFSEDINTLFNDFQECFTLIEAGGGLTLNSQREVLMIYRHEKWDLPKGKLHKNEDNQEGAIREVQEECGVSHLSIIKSLQPTYHSYWIGVKRILKKTYWYKMFNDGVDKLTPQTEEGITGVKWVKQNNLPELTKNTYPSIIEVLKNGRILK